MTTPILLPQPTGRPYLITIRPRLELGEAQSRRFQRELNLWVFDLKPKAPIQQAKAGGLLKVEHSPRPDRKDDTNIIRILSTDWMAWIKVRRER